MKPWMTFKKRLVLALAGSAVVLVACIGPKFNEDSCENFGGVCVSNDVQCGESMPYPCTTGSCCNPAPATASTSTAAPPAAAEDASAASD
jgi:hypothetical protein